MKIFKAGLTVFFKKVILLIEMQAWLLLGFKQYRFRDWLIPDLI